MSSILSRAIASCSILLVWAALFPSAGLGADDESWVGRKIILKRDGIRIGYTGEGGVPVYVADLTDTAYTVLKEQSGWLLVRHRSAEGWFSQTDAVLLAEAIPYFTERLRAGGRDALAYAHRGRAWMEKGDLDKALKDYDEAIRAASEGEEFRPIIGRLLGVRRVTPPPSPAWFRNRGVVFHEKGDYDKAIRDFAEAIRLNPQEPLTYLDRGITYKATKDYDKAVADFSEAIRLDPNWTNAFYNRANTYKAAKDYDKAIADYTQAIRLDPKDPDAWFNRASAYKARKDYDLAANDYREVIQLDPKDPDAFDRLAWLLATCPDAKVRDGRKAVDHAATACELTDGDVPFFLATLAAAYAETGRFELAVRWQKRALANAQYDKEDGDRARQRLKLYQDRKPYRED